jgi:hypothetical protein
MHNRPRNLVGLTVTRQDRRQRLRIGVVAFACFLNLAMPLCEYANAQGKQKSWTEAELYEARNWMPRASNSTPDRRIIESRTLSESRLVTSNLASKRTRYIKTRPRNNLAEYKAKLAAQIGIHRLIKAGRPATSIAPMGLRHVGAHLGLGGGNLEGAGFSARSPYEALAACSFSGRGYPVLYQGVAKGRDGYFAYKIYRR